MCTDFLHDKKVGRLDALFVSIYTENTRLKVDSCAFFVSKRALDRKHCFYQNDAELKYFICCRRTRDQVARIPHIQDVLQIEIFTASTKLCTRKQRAKIAPPLRMCVCVWSAENE